MWPGGHLSSRSVVSSAPTFVFQSDLWCSSCRWRRNLRFGFRSLVPPPAGGRRWEPDYIMGCHSDTEITKIYVGDLLLHSFDTSLGKTQFRLVHSISRGKNVIKWYFSGPEYLSGYLMYSGLDSAAWGGGDIRLYYYGPALRCARAIWGLKG